MPLFQTIPTVGASVGWCSVVPCVDPRNSDTDAMLEETFPNRTAPAVRAKVRNLWTRGLAAKISTVVSWTEEDFQTYMNHPSRFYGVSDEELLCVFPGRSLSAISRKLSVWRKSLKATPGDWEPWTEQDYETFLEHPSFFASN